MYLKYACIVYILVDAAFKYYVNVIVQVDVLLIYC
jgi:hypothetical protein